ncbi:MAG: hypothetical protein LBE08_05055 [Bifidobacteriaceae bacterium]|nr:hypothetical protein [Bifidobacteriaceae bacterium]
MGRAVIRGGRPGEGGGREAGDAEALGADEAEGRAQLDGDDEGFEQTCVVPDAVTAVSELCSRLARLAKSM